MKKAKTTNDLDEIFDEYNIDDDSEVDPYQEAERIVQESFNLKTLKEKRAKINEALLKEPQYFLAYVELGRLESKSNKALEQFRKAAIVGQGVAKPDISYVTNIYEAFIMEDYLRALKCLAEQYFLLWRYEEAIEIYQEMLTVDPGDPLDIKSILIPLFCMNNQDKEAFYTMKEYEYFDNIPMLFNKALVYFRNNDIENTIRYLTLGNKANKYILKYIIDVSKITNFNFATSYTNGSKEQASDYCFKAFRSFRKTKGLMDLIIEFVENQKVDKDVDSFMVS